MAQRVTQKKGPFKIYFKNFNTDQENSAKKEDATGLKRSLSRSDKKTIHKNMHAKGLHTYMQIDGEYYKLINPTCI